MSRFRLRSQLLLVALALFAGFLIFGACGIAHAWPGQGRRSELRPHRALQGSGRGHPAAAENIVSILSDGSPALGSQSRG